MDRWNGGGNDGSLNEANRRKRVYRIARPHYRPYSATAIIQRRFYNFPLSPISYLPSVSPLPLPLSTVSTPCGVIFEDATTRIRGASMREYSRELASLHVRLLRCSLSKQLYRRSRAGIGRPETALSNHDGSQLTPFISRVSPR